MKRIANVRNTLIHGRFEVAAAEAGSRDVRGFFRSHFAGEVESLYQITNGLFKQIDPDTGVRYV